MTQYKNDFRHDRLEMKPVQQHRLITPVPLLLSCAFILIVGVFISLPVSAQPHTHPNDQSISNQAEAMADALRGRAYQDGLSGRQDYAEAARLYRRAAVRGLSLGQYYLGFLYVAGLGVHQDYAEAVRWLRAAGEQGDADAQVLLGILYYHGQGVERNYPHALHWFRLAAKQGRPHAQYSLG